MLGSADRRQDAGGAASEVTIEAAVALAEARRRLDGGLLVMRSLWLASLADLRRWDRATAPLYVRWLDAHRAEIGPRLTNVQAARFCPVLRASLDPTRDGVRLHGTVHLPQGALALLGTWAVVLVGWLALGTWSALATDGPWGWLVFWAVLVVGLGAAYAAGWVHGGRELRARLPELSRVLADPDAGGDDWG